MKNSKYLGVSIMMGVLIVIIILLNVGGDGDVSGTSTHGSMNSQVQSSDESNETVSQQQQGGIETFDGDAPFLGSSDAPVTLVEFGDYQCTYCNRFFDETLPTLKSKYIDTGQVKFVFRDNAINGKESQTAAWASRCAAEQGRFWEYHDKLFNERTGYNNGSLSADNLKKYAVETDLDPIAFNECYDDGRYKEDVRQDGLFGRSIGASGTPTFFLNGSRIPGAQPLSFWEGAIDELLATTI